MEKSKMFNRNVRNLVDTPAKPVMRPQITTRLRVRVAIGGFALVGFLILLFSCVPLKGQAEPRLVQPKSDTKSDTHSDTQPKSGTQCKTRYEIVANNFKLSRENAPKIDQLHLEAVKPIDVNRQPVPVLAPRFNAPVQLESIISVIEGKQPV